MLNHDNIGMRMIHSVVIPEKPPSKRPPKQSRQRTTKVLIRLHGCAGWSAPLLFAYVINRLSNDVAQMIHSMLDYPEDSSLTCFSSAKLYNLESISNKMSSQASVICCMVFCRYWSQRNYDNTFFRIILNFEQYEFTTDLCVQTCSWHVKQCRPWSDCSCRIWVYIGCQDLSARKFRVKTKLILLIFNSKTVIILAGRCT